MFGITPLSGRIALALAAAGALAGCGNSSRSNDSSQQPAETFQTTTFIGSSSGVVTSESYSAKFVLGAQTPHRVGEETIIGNASTESQGGDQ